MWRRSRSARVPIYVYACDRCDVEFEVLKPLGRSDELEMCPICRALLARAPTAAAYLTGVAPPAAADDPTNPLTAARHPIDCLCCAPARR